MKLRVLLWGLVPCVGLLALLAGAQPAPAALITDSVAAQTAPGTSAITPLQVQASTLSTSSNPNAVTIGPQAILITFVNSYSSTYNIDINITVTNAAFSGVPGYTIYDLNGSGKLIPVVATGCALTSSGTGLTASNCNASGSGNIRAIALTGVNYNNAGTLGTAGHSITMAVSVTNHSNASQSYESASATSVVTSTAPTVVHIGAVYATTQTTSQSFLRFYNSSSAAGTVSVTLSDYATGTAFAQWTSPSIPAGASPQYSVATIEQSATAGATKPTSYSVTVTPAFSGAVQHVVWKPGLGTLTDQSVCDSGTAQVATRVTNVQSSLASQYPSTLVVYNTGTSTAAATLQVSNATTGQVLGSYTTAQIPANSQAIVTMAQIESATNISPVSDSITYYNVSISGAFTGFLQHIVNNQQSGIATDMTPVCAFPS